MSESFAAELAGKTGWPRTQLRWRSRCFYCLWLLILAVSVHDGFLVIMNRYAIAHDEQNPVGRWLIEARSGGIEYILIAKLIGTVIVAAILLCMFWNRPGRALVVTAALAFAQLVLLAYLTLI